MLSLGPYTTFDNSRNLSYSEVACATVLTWDVLLMLSEEVDLVWQRAWTPAKVMYLLARYLPWLVQLALLAINVNGTTGLAFNADQCAAWQVVQGVLLQVIVTTVDVILVTRVYALYSRNRVLLALLGSLFVAEVAALCYILAIVTPRLTYNDECYVTSSPPVFQYFWIISLAFETLLFALTIAKFLDAIRQGWGKGPVMRRFVTDGTWAYALIFLTMLVNMMLYKYVHSTLTGICYTWLLVVLSFSGSRLVLNPRRAAAASNRAASFPSDMELSQLSAVRPSRSRSCSYSHSRSRERSYSLEHRYSHSKRKSRSHSKSRSQQRARASPGIVVTIERTTDVLADYESESECEKGECEGGEGCGLEDERELEYELELEHELEHELELGRRAEGCGGGGSVVFAV